MRLVLHLLKKDLRQWWYEIAVTLLVMFAGACSVAYAGASMQMQLVATISSMLAPVLLFLLAGRVMQAERWPSPFEDWRTRPISRVHLAAAKALLLVLFAVIPIWLSYLVTFRGVGYSYDAWLRESPGLLLGLVTVFILPASALMAVTTNWRQALLGTVAFLAALIAAGIGIGVRLLVAAPLSPPFTVLLLLLTDGVALAGLYWQILRNRTWVARGVLLTGWLAVGFLASWRPVWESSILRDWLDPVPASLQSMTLTLLPPARGPAANGERVGDMLVRLQFDAELRGVPDGMVAVPAVAFTVLRDADGREYRRDIIGRPHFDGMRQEYVLSIHPVRYAALPRDPVDLDLHVWNSVYSNAREYSAMVTNHRLAVPDLFECDTLTHQGSTRNGVPVPVCITLRSRLERLDFTWIGQEGEGPFRTGVHVGGDGGFSSGAGGMSLQERFEVDPSPSVWSDGQRVQVRHYQDVAHWHKVLRLRGIRLDDYRRE